MIYCKKCGRLFEDPQDLSRHIMEFHPKEASRLLSGASKAATIAGKVGVKMSKIARKLFTK